MKIPVIFDAFFRIDKVIDLMICVFDIWDDSLL